jgi:DNA-binding NtrC family response regulator
MKQFSDEALEFLMKYDWPGNIRELENMIERLCVLVEGDIIEVEDLPERVRGDGLMEKTITPFPFENGVGFNEAVEKYQKDIILQALNQTNWVKAKAADLLKMNRTTLVEKIKKMRLESLEGTQSDEGIAETIA